MTTQDDELRAALEEAEALVTAITDVAQDGRKMAADLAEQIAAMADLQCGALEARAQSLNARLHDIRRRLAA
ncbi:MAG: hypothetical protein GC189_03255 [Alphaproteobacteria bacterium]|nr:hypothetical protein [Alphaproteobacteria bacterium]